MPVTVKQLEYLARAWQCFTEEPKMDWEKFRTLSNLTTIGSARETLRQAKKRLRDEYGDNNDVTSSSPVAKKSAPKSKKSSGADDDEGSDTEPAPATSKKPTRGQKRKSSNKNSDDQDDELAVDLGDEEVYVKPAKRARKAPAKAAKAAKATSNGNAGKGRGKGKQKADNRVDEVLDRDVQIKSEAPDGDEEEEVQSEERSASEVNGGNDDGDAHRSSSPIVYEFEPL